ncbi:hypothetical protein Taro_038512 [Colocasia esculenta]|uniref:Uncharacterized protein n=1 Tax=Colocasia esculenta TaxID=4460 RepID=A0A843W6X2_COLES|nr:hypothetical protein [Colocasia esculenta]
MNAIVRFRFRQNCHPCQAPSNIDCGIGQIWIGCHIRSPEGDPILGGGALKVEKKAPFPDRFDTTARRSSYVAGSDDVAIEWKRPSRTQRSDMQLGLMQFSSRSSYDTALRQIMRKGRLYNLMKIDRTQWDLQINYSGKTVLLKPPRNAVMEDIERLFSGCNHDVSATEIVTRQGLYGPIRLVLARFPTRTAATTAVCRKNRSFCLNTPVTMHWLLATKAWSTLNPESLSQPL